MYSNVYKKDNNRLLTDSKVSPKATKQAVPADLEWGIDTVNLSFAVNLDLCESDTSLWTSESSRFWADSKRTSSQVEWNYEAEFATIKVILFIDKGLCSLRFNAARLLTPKSRNLLQPALLKELVDNLLTSIRSHVWPEFDEVDALGVVSRSLDWSKRVKVTRLDVARNLYIDDLHSLKETLLKAKPKYGKTSHLFWDSKGGWTLTNETKRSGKDRMYDKDAELYNSDSDEKLNQDVRWFRFESQLQKERLKNNGFSSLDDVTDNRIWDVLCERWDKCTWGVSLPERGTVQEALDGMTPNEKSGILGFLAASFLGIAHELSPSKTRKYGKLCSVLGITPGVPLESLGEPKRVLSLWDGCIITIDKPLQMPPTAAL